MKVVLAPFGSRGDVTPLLALGQALRGRGHQVVAAVPENAAAWTRGLGFEVAPGIPDFRDCFDGTHLEWTVMTRAMARVGASYAALEQAARGADWIVGSMMQYAASSVAEQLGARYAYVALSPPYLRNRSLPMLVLPFRSTPRFLQYVQWWVSDYAPPLFHASLNRERGTRGLPPIGRIFDHVVESGRLFLAADEA
ncbi:MAG: glycosyltransferase, partial [Candidatus Eisenbacteria bacterium]